MTFFLSMCFLGCVFTTTQAAFSITNCSPAGAPLLVNSVTVTPDPIVVPGDVQINIKGSATAPVGSSTIALHIKRKTFLLDIPIPCVSEVGSCTYDDSCTLLSNPEADSVAAQVKAGLAAANIDLTVCPQPVQDIDVSLNLHLPALTGILSVFAEGDYHVHVNVTENATSKQILCLDIEATIEEPCSGLGCLFG